MSVFLSVIFMVSRNLFDMLRMICELAGFYQGPARFDRIGTSPVI